jgi:putative PEP-CTERM system histidine kinase
MELSVILSLLAALLAGGLGLTVLWPRRRSVSDWTFAAGMLLLGIESLLSGLSLDALLPDEKLRWQLRRLMASSILPGMWLTFSVTYSRGNYREFLTRWRWALAAAFFVPPVIVLGFANDLVVAIAQTPKGAWCFGLGHAGIAAKMCFLVSAVVVLANLERTFRAAVGTMRWRIKFMILGLGLLFAVRIYTSSQTLVFRGIDLSLAPLNSGALLVACALILLSLLRAGPDDVSLYPSHSVIHKSLTVGVAGAYLLIVGVFAKIVAFLGGDAAFQVKAFLVLLALVVLAMALVSDRVRLVTKRFVSRHFQRPIYDYRAIWKSFTEATAQCVEPNTLCSAVAKLASDTFQALSVSVWLVNERRELVLAASTSLTRPTAETAKLDSVSTEQIMAGLAQQAEPMDLDSSRADWAAGLRRLNIDQFPNGGDRICVPLGASSELLGLVVLGDRVSGVPYSLQDFDLLKSISHQASAGLLNIRLSQKLGQGKQLEAFQAMSAFFVHDLKNTASTLSLMLQNLPVHYADPSFREDALRGISKTVGHINELISRLTLLRQNLTPQSIVSDLNQILDQAIKSFPESPGVQLVKDLRPLPKVPVDPGQIQNVVTNLLLNARDAIGANGRIEVQSSRLDGWAMLSVSDTGCGMTPEFIQNSLFRPFQTTKKKGLGIGMFQCKTIVEAHHGKLEVESAPGKGTTFRVLLPVGD